MRQDRAASSVNLRDVYVRVYIGFQAESAAPYFKRRHLVPSEWTFRIENEVRTNFAAFRANNLAYLIIRAFIRSYYFHVLIIQ